MKRVLLAQISKSNHEPAWLRTRQLQNQQKAVDASMKKCRPLVVASSSTPHRRKSRPRLPPQVQAQQATRVASSFSLYKFATRKQLIALVFALMISGAYVVDASASIDQTKKQEQRHRAVDKDSIYRAVCTDTSLLATNKPAVRIAMSSDGTEVPKSCLLWNRKADCDRDMLLWRQFRPDEARTNKVYSNSLTAYHQWKKSFLGDWELIQPTLYNDDSEITAQIWKTISNLAMLYHSSNVINEEKAGVCTDHAKVALYNLMKSNVTHGLDMKIQRIQLDPNVDRHETEHMYLLLDGDIPDQQIENDPEAVRRALGSITRGQICDTWNLGYLGAFVPDVSGYYHNRGLHHTKNWASLTIDTFSLDFSVFNELTGRMKQFVCEQVAALGIPLEREPICFQFFGRKAAVQEPETASLDLLPFLS